jgi:phosphotriesterase-related protein
LRACAIAQQQTGAAISLHPSPNDEAVLEIVKILGDAGANLSRTVIGHVDVWAFSRPTLRKLANAGCYIEYDTFGRPGPMPIYLGQVLDAPSDTQRINDIMALIAEGHLNHILISHDVCHKHLLVSYGGYGYAHILRNIVPIMRSKGMSDEQIHTLLVENPKRALTFTAVKKD